MQTPRPAERLPVVLLEEEVEEIAMRTNPRERVKKTGPKNTIFQGVVNDSVEEIRSYVERKDGGIIQLTMDWMDERFWNLLSDVGFMANAVQGYRAARFMGFGNTEITPFSTETDLLERMDIRLGQIIGQAAAMRCIVRQRGMNTDKKRGREVIQRSLGRGHKQKPMEESVT